MENRRSYRGKRARKNVLYHAVTLAGACIMVYPLVWMIMSTFKESGEIFKTAARLIPDTFTLENYKTGWQGF